MSDCPATGGTHAFVLDSITDEVDDRRTKHYTCPCGAEQTITGPVECDGGRNR
jgi:hypothetical protein